MFPECHADAITLPHGGVILLMVDITSVNIISGKRMDWMPDS